MVYSTEHLEISVRWNAFVLGPYKHTVGKSPTPKELSLRNAWGWKNNDSLFVAADTNHRKVMWLAQGYTCNLWQSWDLCFHLAAQCLNKKTFIPLAVWKWPAWLQNIPGSEEVILSSPSVSKCSMKPARVPSLQNLPS